MALLLNQFVIKGSKFCGKVKINMKIDEVKVVSASVLFNGRLSWSGRWSTSRRTMMTMVSRPWEVASARFTPCMAGMCWCPALTDRVIHQQVRLQSRKSKSSQELVEAKEPTFGQLSTVQKVQQTTKDVTYTAVIVVGVGITAIMFYVIGRELFSTQSPSGVFGEALKLCKKNDQIRDTLGEPIKGYGETTRRGRRRHVSHLEWLSDDGVKHMRMKFYVEGPSAKGTAHLEVKQNDRGKYEYRYLFVTLDSYPNRTIIIQDNR
ncbi:mitochondrial import inner membrane translocase subunit Tim21-like [Lineus longissimus]|uniref:mitochondrial import inner membrane translocase subunit Tim21-like n=1 Tax=Lineus longissimus TaxID=88925 RepID=UPI002B4EF7FD